MIYFLQLQRLGLATIHPIVGTKGYVVIATVRDNAELQELLLDNPMWPVEDYRVLAVNPLWDSSATSDGVAEDTSAAVAEDRGTREAQRFVIFARPSFPIPRKANVGKTRVLLQQLAARDPQGRLYEIVEDGGFGFVVIGSARDHDQLLRELFAVPLGNWGEFEVHALGSLAGEHEAVMAAGMVPAGSLARGERERSGQPARANGAARDGGPRELDAGWGTIRDLRAEELTDLLMDSSRPLTLVDVRTAEELGGGSIPGALSVPLDELDEALDRWGAAAPPNLVFVCERGSRSRLAARAASRRGVSCASLKGGLRAWRELGHRVEVGGRHG